MDTPHLTSALMWRGTAVGVVLAAALLLVVIRRVPPSRFARLARPVALTASAFWFVVWAYAMWGPWWDLAYRHVFPAWARWIVPPAYGALFSATALGLWWLARRTPAAPAATFCLLGGLVSLPGHLFAFYGRDMLRNVPILQGVSVQSALVFGVFEFMVYWAVILLVAEGLARTRGH